eukprot:TRINITY_DN3087_c0_g1_i5.p1 TRINITY_DN3087_c0_g1~~TRINITY_DN3087_c0_g1_i5.p1  ORF type:complete len:189 (+),score=-28.74 TRINITY_DN3087_c0_g1_i5:223-789(+)
MQYMQSIYQTVLYLTVYQIYKLNILCIYLKKGVQIAYLETFKWEKGRFSPFFPLKRFQRIVDNSLKLSTISNKTQLKNMLNMMYMFLAHFLHQYAYTIFINIINQTIRNLFILYIHVHHDLHSHHFYRKISPPFDTSKIKLKKFTYLICFQCIIGKILLYIFNYGLHFQYMQSIYKTVHTQPFIRFTN